MQKLNVVWLGIEDCGAGGGEMVQHRCRLGWLPHILFFARPLLVDCLSRFFYSVLLASPLFCWSALCHVHLAFAWRAFFSPIRMHSSRVTLAGTIQLPELSAKGLCIPLSHVPLSAHLIV